MEALDALVAYCDEAAELTARGRKAYESDVLLRRASEAIFHHVGDTIRNSLPPRLLEEHPGQPWSLIVGMRVRMAHIYAENDTSIMWNTLVEHVPRLREYIAHGILRG
ncbi:HepT-like ribonuclease domain-containing protein [Tomitella gaofuii]|uniref:HepT-like ribonuclease domain-containing protein n=1 Tax=Tomitella gaofuii TaxID=2760083 RepID=UPI0015FAF563|nr:HepT-like ribonuclease domain-containing protein [Tomitella gaofuii]